MSMLQTRCYTTTLKVGQKWHYHAFKGCCLKTTLNSVRSCLQETQSLCNKTRLVSPVPHTVCVRSLLKAPLGSARNMIYFQKKQYDQQPAWLTLNIWFYQKLLVQFLHFKTTLDRFANYLLQNGKHHVHV